MTQKTPRIYIENERQYGPKLNKYNLSQRDSILELPSHCIVGYVFEKNDDKFYRHTVKVGIDEDHLTTHTFVETDYRYTRIYKSINVGDKVIVQVSDEKPEINRVIDWNPSKEDLEKFRTAIAFEPAMWIKDHSQCSKDFEKEMLHKSHKRVGQIFAKYLDDNIGAYLEIGIDRTHTYIPVQNCHTKRDEYV